MGVSWTSQRSGNWSRTSDNADSPWYDGGAGHTQSDRASIPAAGDAVTKATGHTIVQDAGATRIPPTSGTLASLTGVGTGSITADLSVIGDAAILADTMTAGADASLIITSGTAHSPMKTLSVTGTACLTSATDTTAFITQGSTGTLSFTGSIVCRIGRGIQGSAAGPINIVGSITAGTNTGTASYGLYNAMSSPVTWSNGNISGGTGNAAVGFLNDGGPAPVFTNVNLVNTATGMAYMGQKAPSTWVMTARQNYEQWPAVNLEGAGNAVVKMAVALAPGLVLKDQTGYYSDGTLLGTRTDCLVAKAQYTGTPYYGDPAALVDGALMLPNALPTLIVGGDPDPDVTGEYTRVADTNGYPAYKWNDGNYWLWWNADGGGHAYITDELGAGNESNHNSWDELCTPLTMNLENEFAPGGLASGNPLVSYHPTAADPDLVLTTGYYGVIGALVQGDYIEPDPAGYSDLADGYGAGGLTSGTLDSTKIMVAVYGSLEADNVLIAGGGDYVEPVASEIWDAASGGTAYGSAGEYGTFDKTTYISAAAIAAVYAQRAKMTTEVVNLLDAANDGTINMSLYQLHTNVEDFLETNKAEIIPADTAIEAEYGVVGTAPAGGGVSLIGDGGLIG